MQDLEPKLQIKDFSVDYLRLKKEIGKVIVGQHSVVEEVLIALFAKGNCLFEGVPGLGKTLLVSTLSKVLDLHFNRIQFTPDLMPADITGTNILREDESGRKFFEFQPGPLFCNIVLADEINRATPKTQSAMLEAMQERHVTTGGEIRNLPNPFVVLATQNPLEMEGTYPLPEAQLDRFMLKILVDFSSRAELNEILLRTTKPTEAEVKKVLTSEKIVKYQQLVREIVIAPHILDYATRIVLATHPDNQMAPEIVKKYVRYGASPRGAQSLVLSGKVRALIDNRYNVAFVDVEESAFSCLRHRLILNFEGEAEGIAPEKIIEEIIRNVPREADLPS